MATSKAQGSKADKEWEVVRSFDAFVRGDRFHAPDDDWTQGRRQFLREVGVDADVSTGRAGQGSAAEGGSAG